MHHLHSSAISATLYLNISPSLFPIYSVFTPPSPSKNFSLSVNRKILFLFTMDGHGSACSSGCLNCTLNRFKLGLYCCENGSISDESCPDFAPIPHPVPDTFNPDDLGTEVEESNNEDVVPNTPGFEKFSNSTGSDDFSNNEVDTENICAQYLEPTTFVPDSCAEEVVACGDEVVACGEEDGRNVETTPKYKIEVEESPSSKRFRLFGHRFLAKRKIHLEKERLKEKG